MAFYPITKRASLVTALRVIVGCCAGTITVKATGPVGGDAPRLVGIWIEPSLIQFSVDLRDGHSAFWLPLGVERHGVTALEFDAEKKSLRVLINGREQSLQLANAVIGAAELASFQPPPTTERVQELARMAALNPRLAAEYADAGLALPAHVPPARPLSAERKLRNASRAAEALRTGASETPNPSAVAAVKTPAKAEKIDKSLNPRLWGEK